MKVLVIIVSYHFEPWIDRCLGSLRLSQYPVDTVVIDNGSTDRTIQRIQNDYPEVRLLPQAKNLGFGKANNIGMQIAVAEGYDIVFLLNQDAWIDSNTIGKLVALSQSHPQYGILSPVHLTGKETNPTQDSDIMHTYSNWTNYPIAIYWTYLLPMPLSG